jgi:hypothetical protein
LIPKRKLHDGLSNETGMENSSPLLKAAVEVLFGQAAGIF